MTHSCPAGFDPWGKLYISKPVLPPRVSCVSNTRLPNVTASVSRLRKRIHPQSKLISGKGKRLIKTARAWLWMGVTVCGGRLEEAGKQHKIMKWKGGLLQGSWERLAEGRDEGRELCSCLFFLSLITLSVSTVHVCVHQPRALLCDRKNKQTLPFTYAHMNKHKEWLMGEAD